MSELDYYASEEWQTAKRAWFEAPYNSVKELQALVAWAKVAQGLLDKNKAPEQPWRGFTGVVEHTFFRTSTPDETKAAIWADADFNYKVRRWHSADDSAKLWWYSDIIKWVDARVAELQEAKAPVRGVAHPLAEEVSCCLDNESKDVEESTYTSVIGW